jgi:hypothetical protein
MSRKLAIIPFVTIGLAAVAVPAFAQSTPPASHAATDLTPYSCEYNVNNPNIRIWFEPIGAPNNQVVGGTEPGDVFASAPSTTDTYPNNGESIFGVDTRTNVIGWIGHQYLQLGSCYDA